MPTSAVQWLNEIGQAFTRFLLIGRHWPNGRHPHVTVATSSGPSLVLSLVSLTVAAIALFVNITGLVRRPRIEGSWKQDDPSGGITPAHEYLEIIVTARKRTIEVREVGILVLSKRTGRRQYREGSLTTDNHFRFRLGDSEAMTLSDGATLRRGIELDHAVEELGGRKGRDYCYVLASGTLYFARPDSKFRRLLRPKAS
jgi:hypothetical protein